MRLERRVNMPFFKRTTDTFVNLIWLEGWLIGISKTAFSRLFPGP